MESHQLKPMEKYQTIHVRISDDMMFNCERLVAKEMCKREERRFRNISEIVRIALSRMLRKEGF